MKRRREPRLERVLQHHFVLGKVHSSRGDVITALSQFDTVIDLAKSHAPSATGPDQPYSYDSLPKRVPQGMIVSAAHNGAGEVEMDLASMECKDMQLHGQHINRARVRFQAALAAWPENASALLSLADMVPGMLFSFFSLLPMVRSMIRVCCH